MAGRAERTPSWGAVANYELIERLAIGGMGEVFLARQTGIAGFRRIAVVKRMLPELAEQPGFVELFVDEARVAALLAHPNIVQIYELGSDGGAFFLAMEHVHGQTVARMQRRSSRTGRPTPIPVAAHIVSEVTRALDFAHDARDADGVPLELVHRDVTPHNVLVSYTGHVKLMDFGIAKAANALHRTRTGVVRGKYAYMAPEQLAASDVDRRADLFSAGVVLWELTCGRALFPGANDLDVARRIAAGEIPRPRTVVPDYPHALEDIVMHALERDADRRIGSAAELGARLRGYLSDCGAEVGADALSAHVTSLFPDELRESEARLAVAAEDPQTLSANAGAGTTPTPPAEPAVSAPATGRTGAKLRRAGLAAALLVAAAAGAVAWWPSPSATIDAAPAAVEGTERAAPGAPPDPGLARRAPRDTPTAVADAPQPDAGAAIRQEPGPSRQRDGDVPVRSSSHRKRRSPTRRAGAGVTRTARPDRERAAPAAVAAPARAPDAGAGEVDDRPGTLVVASKPWGDVWIDGAAHGQTDLVVQRAAGSYRVRIAVSGGGATVTGVARVAAARTTKCRVDGAALRCGSPR
jgi:serine/threonine-protein kinase